MTKSFLLLIALSCAGCAGSDLVYGPEEAPHGDFPDLHDVPDKPDFVTRKDAGDLEEKMTSGYAESVARHDAQRRAAGLESSPIN